MSINGLDPISSKLSPTEFQLERLQVNLHWLHEHALSVENPRLREDLVNAAVQAKEHLAYLKHLLTLKVISLRGD